MNHVIVIDSFNSTLSLNKNSARSFIEAQGLKHPHALQNHRMDSELLFNHPELLQSTDDIQFYLFHQKFPAANAGHFTGFEHLEKHLEVLTERLRKRNKSRRPEHHETIDAIVIPDGVLENASTLRWLDRMRAQWPELKVMVTNPTIHPVTDPLRDDVYVQARNEHIPPNYTDPNYYPSDKKPYVAIMQNATNFRLAPQVHMATPNLRGLMVQPEPRRLDDEPTLDDNALLLRHLIGVITIIGEKDLPAGKPTGGRGRG